MSPRSRPSSRRSQQSSALARAPGQGIPGTRASVRSAHGETPACAVGSRTIVAPLAPLFSHPATHGLSLFFHTVSRDRPIRPFRQLRPAHGPAAGRGAPHSAGVLSPHRKIICMAGSRYLTPAPISEVHRAPTVASAARLRHVSQHTPAARTAPLALRAASARDPPSAARRIQLDSEPQHAAALCNLSGRPDCSRLRSQTPHLNRARPILVSLCHVSNRLGHIRAQLQQVREQVGAGAAQFARLLQRFC